MCNHLGFIFIWPPCSVLLFVKLYTVCVCVCVIVRLQAGGLNGLCFSSTASAVAFVVDTPPLPPNFCFYVCVCVCARDRERERVPVAATLIGPTARYLSHSH